MIFVLAVFGLIGLAVGSFLTVVISRLGSGQTIVWGRSRCVHCGKELRWFELLPVLSFILQGGYCRSCAKPIPRIYPAIELSLALLFVSIGWGVLRGILPTPPFSPHFSGVLISGGWLTLTFLYYAFFAAVAVAVSFYDFIKRLVPYELVVPLGVVGFGAELGASFRYGSFSPLFLAGAAAAAWFLFFWAIWFFSKGRAMGRGDADVALVIALYLGPTISLWGFLFAFWFGALIGVMLMVVGKLGWKSQIPFTPFLFLGAIAALFVSGSSFVVKYIPYVF